MFYIIHSFKILRNTNYVLDTNYADTDFPI